MCEYLCDTPRGKMCNATNSICPYESDDCATRLETIISEWISGDRDLNEENAEIVRNYLGKYGLTPMELNDMPLEER